MHFAAHTQKLQPCVCEAAALRTAGVLSKRAMAAAAAPSGTGELPAPPTPLGVHMDAGNIFAVLNTLAFLAVPPVALAVEGPGMASAWEAALSRGPHTRNELVRAPCAVHAPCAVRRACPVRRARVSAHGTRGGIMKRGGYHEGPTLPKRLAAASPARQGLTLTRWAASSLLASASTCTTRSPYTH